MLWLISKKFFVNKLNVYVSNSVQFLDKKKGKHFLEEQLFYHNDIVLFQISLLLH